MSKEHTKHSFLVKPSYGRFGRNEWSITGTDCDRIKQISSAVISALSEQYTCAYIDTQHQKDESNLPLPGMLASGAALEYSNQINHTQLAFASTNENNLQSFFSQSDLILVNGNHHSASNQVIIIDEKKRASLQKRMAGLNNIRLILLAGDSMEPFDFVWDFLEGRNDICIISITDTEKIIAFFKEQLKLSQPPLYGLVLAGGRSQRMGADKPSMSWHGKEQRYFLADLLKTRCEKVFISCRDDQQTELENNYPSITDSFTGLGPYGAILSAFRAYPDAAWLILASDLPLLNGQTLDYLIDHRQVSTIATAYQQPGNGKPEPLIAIWEPKSYPVLLSFLSRGYSCPKKVLENNPVTLLEAIDASELMNVNTPEDKELASSLLTAKSTQVYE